MLGPLKKYRDGVWAALLIAAVLANIAAYRLLKQYYAEAKTAAVFPSHAAHFARDNRALPAKAKKRIVLFGDSRIVQWQNFPSLDGFEVVNRGVNGETTAQMRTRFDRDVLALDPDVVVLQAGINDLVAIGVLPARQAEIVDQCADNIRYFVDALRAKNIRAVLLTIIPPDRVSIWRRPVWSDQIPAAVEKLNRQWLTAPAVPMLHVVDTGSALQGQAGRWRDGVNADTLHLTPRGYEYLNGAVIPAIRD